MFPWLNQTYFAIWFFIIDWLLIILVIVPRLLQDKSDLVGIIQAVTGIIGLALTILPLLISTNPRDIQAVWQAFKNNSLLLKDFIIASGFWLILITALIFPLHNKEIEQLKQEILAYPTPPNASANKVAPLSPSSASTPAIEPTSSYESDLQLKLNSLQPISGNLGVYEYVGFSNNKDISKVKLRNSPEDTIKYFIENGLEYPKLLITIINNSSKVLAFDGVDITIESIRVNKDPLLITQLRYEDEKIFLDIDNYGWGLVVSPSIKYNIFYKAEECSSLSKGDYLYTDDFNVFLNGPEDIYLLPLKDLTEASLPECLKGEFLYKTETGDEKLLRFNHPFKKSYPANYGVEHRIQDSFNFELPSTEGPAGTLVIKRSIPAGKDDYFYIALRGSQSATFDLKFSLRAEGREISNQRIQVDLFTPRNYYPVQ